MPRKPGVGRDPDPAKSRDHVLLSVLAERRLRAGQSCSLGELLDDVLHPPIDKIGALPVRRFLSNKHRSDLAAALNTLLASPSFASWREGGPLDSARSRRKEALCVIGPLR